MYHPYNQVHVSHLDTDGEKVLAATELTSGIADLIHKFGESKHIQKILVEQGEALQIQGGIDGTFFKNHILFEFV